MATADGGISCYRGVVFLLAGLMSLTTAHRVTGPNDFCENETFMARCQSNEAIIITEARYGRMQINKCVQNQIGCETSIITYMDMACSGKPNCSVAVRDLFVSQYVTSPCGSDVRNYLRVTYTCVPVAVAVLRCPDRTQVQIEANSPGYLSSYITENSNCGSSEAPWKIKAPPGQSLSFTLYEFGRTVRAPYNKNCRVLVVIAEHGVPTKTLCSQHQRISAGVHTSSSNEVVVRMHPEQQDSQDGFQASHFLLKYEVLGCPDPVMDSDTLFERTQSGAWLQCKRRDHAWEVTCRDNIWHGRMVNCSEYMLLEVKQPAANEALPLPSSLSIVIVLAIAVLIGLGILIVGLLYLRKRRNNRNTGEQVTTEADPSQKLGELDQYHTAVSPGGHYSQTHSPHTDSIYDPSGMRGNAYYRTWELQRHNHPMQTSGADVGAHGEPGPDRPSHHYHHQTSVCSDIPETPSEKYHDIEHIYESPKSLRKEMPMMKDGLQYYELDPSNSDSSQVNQIRFGNSYST